MTAVQISDLEIGKAAEHLVVADLILSGYRAYLTEQGLPYDVVLDYEHSLYRIQVKATRAPSPMPQRKHQTPGYLFQVRRSGKGGKRQHCDEEFDAVALVALDVRVIAYLPFDSRVLQTIWLRPPGFQHSPRAERTRNIDQYPIESAWAVLTGKPPVLAPRTSALRIIEPRQQTLFGAA